MPFDITDDRQIKRLRETSLGRAFTRASGKLLGSIVLILGIAAGLSACSDRIVVKICDHDEKFSKTTNNVYGVTTVVEGSEVEIKVYGFEKAKELTKLPNWNGRLMVRVTNPEVKIRKRLFPPMPEMHRVDIGYDVYHDDASRIEWSVERDMELARAPVIWIGAPGVYGASGSISTIYEERGFAAISAVLDHVVEDLGAQQIIVYGQSSSGNIVAGLTTLRTDILCAVISSAPLDLVGNNAFNPRLRHNLGAEPIYSPVDNVDRVQVSSERTIWLGYNEEDEVVSSASTLGFASELEKRGHSVVVETAPSLDSKHHDLSIWAWKTAQACFHSAS